MTDPKYVPAPRPTSTPDEIIDTLERLKRPPRDHRLHVAVSAEELRALDAEAARTGLSRSDVARLRLVVAPKGTATRSGARMAAFFGDESCQNYPKSSPHARKNDASKTGQVHLRVTDAERRLLDRVVAARRSTMTAVVLELVDREHRRLVRERGERNEATPPKEEA